jgi:EAL domain-containing protein (putative c-di-GMP-specific phosphodiesterase class I)
VSFEVSGMIKPFHMAHTLRLKVLAEGVETEEQLNFLKEHGCDFYQGYYKSPAVPAETFAALLKQCT